MSSWSGVGSRRRITALPHAAVRAAADEPLPALKPKSVYRFVKGIDASPRELTQAELQALGDPLGKMLGAGKFPVKVNDVLAELDSAGILKKQQSYLVGEAGQISPDAHPELLRDMRFAITRGDDANSDLLISTGALGDPAVAFLQVAGWDTDRELFNYYMRIDQAWVWAGNSYSALSPGSRGNGCFDSHVNGSLVMKELRQPWLNWESMNATIRLSADDPLRRNPLYINVSGAEKLEITVRATISRWTAARLDHVLSPDKRLSDPDRLLRQFLTTTTVNLASTLDESGVVAADPNRELILPPGFWLNGALLIDALKIPASFQPPRVPGNLYLDSLAQFDFNLVEGDFRQSGDTFFAFVVPEAAFEDIDVVDQMVRNGIISARFAASALMVDFANPVFSPRRARLLKYAPNQPASVRDDRLSQQMAGAIATAAGSLPQESPEREFTANWQLPADSWRPVFAKRIEAYLSAVSRLAGTAEGFNAYVRLAESRRREFKVMRLNEFALTLPTTNIPASAPTLEMKTDGTVSEKQAG